MKCRQMISALLVACAMVGCAKSGSTSMKPEVLGQNGEVLVVISDHVKTDTAGGYLKAMLGDTFVGLPAAEPVFDMRTVPHGYFDRPMHNFRNLIIVNVQDTVSRDTILYMKDVWAAPQAVITVSASKAANVPAMLKRHHVKMLSYLSQAERNRLMTYYKRINSIDISTKLKKKWGVDILVPNHFKWCTPEDTSAISWVYSDTKEYTDGLLVYDFPYEGAQSMSKITLLNKRDSLVRANIGGPQGSHMCIESRLGLDEIDYKFGRKMHQGLDVAEIRGLWRMDGYPMGGPFYMRAVHDTIGNRVVVTDGFVYYPSKEHKRNHIRQLDAIMRTMQIEGVRNAKTENNK